MTKKGRESIQRLKELEEIIRQHDERYYRNASPSISDQAYDSLKKELEILKEQVDPLGLFASEITGEDKSFSNLIGDDRLESFESHRHQLPMLSLDNTYDKEEFFEFDRRLRKYSTVPPCPML